MKGNGKMVKKMELEGIFTILKTITMLGLGKMIKDMVPMASTLALLGVFLDSGQMGECQKECFILISQTINIRVDSQTTNSCKDK